MQLKTLRKTILLLIVFILTNAQVAQAASVTVNQKSGQADPASVAPVLFTAVFSQSINVSTFTAADISTGGSTAPGVSVDSITEISPNDGTTFDIAVSASGAGDIVIDVPAGSVNYNSTTFASTDATPIEITKDSAGNIYTANANAATVTKITPAGVSTTLGTTNPDPMSIIVDASGTVYTANRVTDTVTKITPAGVSTTLASTGTNPRGIAMDASGNIYTANFGADSVSKITPAGVSAILGTTGASPYGIVVDSSGNVYTANSDSNNVSKITPAGVSTILAATGAGPTGIVLDSSGNVYTTNSGANNVSKITPAGVSTILGTTGSVPFSVAIDASGNIYTANLAASSVTRITPSGVSTTIGSTGSFPRGITIDSSGNIYTADSNSDTVTKIAYAGITGIEDTSLNPNAASTSTDNVITLALLTSSSTSDTITINLPINATISITSPVDVTMGAITGTGQSALSTNQAEWITKTNNAAGYELSIQASNTSLQNTNLDTVGAYTPATPSTPEPWSVAATDSEWGMHYSFPQSTLGNDTIWGIGDTYADNWVNVPATPYVIETATAPTDNIGDSAVIIFGAEIGASKIQPTGTYSVDVTMTATTL